MNETTNEHRSVLPLDGSVLLRARAEINSHFGASAGRADARRRDAGDVGHRRGAATKPIRALAAVPLRAAARRPAAKCEVISARALSRGSFAKWQEFAVK